jgi:quinol monooxygenase YgiN
MVVGTIRIPSSLPERRREVLEILQSILGPVRALPDCEACHIYEEPAKEAIVLVERWQTEAALEAHIRSEAYRRILGAIELSDGPPEIRFEHVSGDAGMELVERLRNPSGPGGPPERLKKAKQRRRPPTRVEPKEPSN